MSPNTFVDSHAHIYHKQFVKDIDDMLQRSFEAGVREIYMPNIDHSTVDAMMELEQRYPSHCFSTMGVHPCSIKQDFEKELYLVEEWLSRRAFVAIGETGIDLYWDKTFLEQQEEALRIQARWAKQHQIPIILHCRDSFEETISVIEQEQDGQLTGIFHCFTGSVADAKRILELGFYIGLGGVATFKNGGLDEVIPELPLERVVLETDSPYLAPVPHRGKRNEPSYVPLVAQKIADVLARPVEEVAIATTAAAHQVFQQTADHEV